MQWGGAQGNNRVAAAQNADPLNDHMQGALRAKTHLIQLYIDDVEEAVRKISETHHEGIPIMALPINQGANCCCCTLKLNVPNGMYTLQQNWGVDEGIMEPGCYPCFPCWKRVAVMVTKNTIRFRCPVTQVPTKDFVRVSLDVGINFHIGRVQEANIAGDLKRQQEEDIKKFFYNFGPNRLEELLQEECEEEIRTFLSHIKVGRVRDIKTELTTQMTADLQKKFEPYGVVIEQVNIMNVILPVDLRFALMQTTTFDVFLQKQVKQQENRLLQLNNAENKQLLRLKRDNIQQLMTFQHNYDLEEIALFQTEIECQTNQQISEIKAMQRQSVQTINADNIRNLAQIRAEAFKTKVLQEAEAYRTAITIQADKDANIIRQNAAARLQVAQNKSKALITEANAEEKCSGNMEGMRRFSEKLKMANGLKKLATQGHMVISGKQGEQVLDFYSATLDLVASR